MAPNAGNQSPDSTTENIFEPNASLIFNELEKSPRFWDVNQDNCRDSWCRYRSSAPEYTKSIKHFINNEKFCERGKDEGMQISVDVSLDITVSLNACSLEVRDASSQENDSTLKPPPVKRARIVKPPEGSISDEKPTPKIHPFSFLAREEDNRQRKEARRSYYELLAKRAGPQPFKARPMPNFKPVSLTPPKFIAKNSSPQVKVAQTTTKTSVKTPSLTQKTSKPTGAFTPRSQSIPNAKSNVFRPISPPRSSQPAGGLSQISRESRLLRIPAKSARALPSQGLNKTTGNSPQVKSSLKRKFGTLTTSGIIKSPPIVQGLKSVEGTPRRHTITVPRCPQLSTAIRAQERRQFEEMRQEKERRRETVRKMEIATNRYYEQEAVRELRKSLVHKPVPLPNSPNGSVMKRPANHPMLPDFIKRPRWS
ncbi:uncharacterized protein LOC135164848 [Diachasmimorpha longicaudata]|uniref:uncharacterized protein LOC135164848 n=1 Tax=Diachasmimorpha longicaudata TaxID=58733 RepID=UPI0030B8BEC5